jgi:hypothetical protein
MIQLQQETGNEFIIYANTISNDVEEFGDYFLIGFQSGFTKLWTYVIPYVLTRNSRYLKFQITLVANISIEDPANGIVYLDPSGNWDYKIWNTDYATLDPATGNLIDSGQMILEDQNPPEVFFEQFVSGNDILEAVVYQGPTGETGPVIYQSVNDTLESYVYYTANGVWNNTANQMNYQQNVWEAGITGPTGPYN